MAKIVVACGLVLAGFALPSSACAVVLYDQTASPGTLTTYSMDYVAPNDVQAADDFTVPAGQQWTITEVDVLGAGGSFKTHVRIYSNAGGLPGTVLFAEDEITPTNKGTDFNSPLATPPVLGPGTYWVSVAAPAFWSWRNSTSTSGYPAVWQNPSGEFSLGPNEGCGKTWTARTACFPESASEPDQAFRLVGPEPALIKPSNLFSFGKLKLNRKKGNATLAVKVPGPGALRLSGKGLKASKAIAPAAGTVKLKLKAAGKAKKKLKATGKAKVRAKVTFTPTGGDPATKSRAVKLKKL
ncbi:MAG: choice-of-anchor R domain-containing protein [Solirubrobacterales bacterium]